MATTIEQVIENERKEREAFEANKVVTEQGETIADLRKVFNSVCDKDDWKAPFAVAAPSSLVGVIIRAVQFFHGDTPRVVGMEGLTGRVFIEGNGYAC